MIYPENRIRRQSSVYLFWTGGFDSSFRLCQLTIDENRIVQPIYLACRIDKRQNKKTEIAVMNRFRAVFRERFAGKKDLFLAPIISDKNRSRAIRKDASIWQDGRVLIKRKKMGWQYERLCRYAKQFCRDRRLRDQGIEICIEIGGRAERLLRDAVDQNEHGYRLKQHLAAGQEKLHIFKNLRFPLINMTRPDMLATARRSGYADLLELTWSCWFPKGGRPCRSCDMCRRRRKELRLKQTSPFLNRKKRAS